MYYPIKVHLSDAQPSIGMTCLPRGPVLALGNHMEGSQRTACSSFGPSVEQPLVRTCGCSRDRLRRAHYLPLSSGLCCSLVAPSRRIRRAGAKTKRPIRRPRRRPRRLGSRTCKCGLVHRRSQAPTAGLRCVADSASITCGALWPLQ